MITTTPNDIRLMLAKQCAAIRGIRRSLPYVPNTVPDDLPLVAITLGAMRANYPDDVRVRTYLLRLYVVSIHAAIDQDLPGLLDPFYARFDEFFQEQLSFDLPWVQRITLTGDSGESVLTHAGETFLGTTFSLEVVSYVRHP